MIATINDRFAVMKPTACVAILIALIFALSFDRYTNMNI
jgi:hypothetical protein